MMPLITRAQFSAGRVICPVPQNFDTAAEF